MPNWCNNSLTIIGKDIDIISFLNDGLQAAGKIKIRRLEKGDIPNDGVSLRSWLPMPETFNKYDTTNHPDGKGLTIGEKDDKGRIIDENLIEEYKKATEEQQSLYGAVGWYNYNIKTIGTKWDADFDSDFYLEPDSDSDNWILNVTLSTAWSPCIEWLRNIYTTYPHLHFYLNYDECGAGYEGETEAFGDEQYFKDDSWDYVESTEVNI